MVVKLDEIFEVGVFFDLVVVVKVLVGEVGFFKVEVYTVIEVPDGVETVFMGFVELVVLELKDDVKVPAVRVEFIVFVELIDRVKLVE